MWEYSVLIALVLGLVSLALKRDLLYPGVLFNFLWCFVIWLTHQNVKGYFSVSTTVDGIMLIGLICFNIPTLIYCIPVKAFSSTGSSVDTIAASISPKKLKIFQFLLIVVMLPLFVTSFREIMSAGLGSLRWTYSTDQNGFMTLMERKIYTYFFVFPMATGLFSVSAFLWARNLIKFRELTLGFVGVLMETVITAGRMPIMNAVIILLVAYKLINKRRASKHDRIGLRLFKKNRRIIIYVLSVCAVLGAVITFQRTSGHVSLINYFLQTIGSYLTIGPRILDLAIQNPPLFGLDSNTWRHICWRFLGDF